MARKVWIVEEYPEDGSESSDEEEIYHAHIIGVFGSRESAYQHIRDKLVNRIKKDTASYRDWLKDNNLRDNLRITKITSLLGVKIWLKK